MPRPRAWGDTVINQAMTSALQVNTDLLSDLSASDVKTAIRIIGHVVVLPNVPGNVVDGLSRIDLAIGVSAVEAFNANILPDAPASGEVPARGWLWADRLAVLHSTDANGVVNMHNPEVRFDVRSMRKVDRGILYLQMTTTLISGTFFDLSIVGRIRVLCVT